MIDTLQIFAVPPVAKITSAKASADASKIHAEATRFSETFAQLTEQTAASSKSATFELVWPTAAQVRDTDDKADATTVDPGTGVDIAALIALAVADLPPTPMTVSGNVSVDFSSIAPLTLAPDGVTANAAALMSIPGTYINAAVFGDQTTAFPDQPAVIAGDSLPNAPVNATPQADGAHRGTARAIFALSTESPIQDLIIPAPETNSTDGSAARKPDVAANSEDAAPKLMGERRADGTARPQTILQEIGLNDLGQTNSEKNQPAHQLVEMTPIATLAAGNSAQAVVANSAVGPAATLLVPTHVESPAWSKDFGQHVIRLAVDGQPTAEIHLNPPELGPIHVTIEINGRDATLQLSAEHLQTREALESALPRLREMFAASSITLADANVTSQSPSVSQHAFGSPGQRFDQHGTPRGARALAVEDAAPESISRVRPSASRSRVDLFA